MSGVWALKSRIKGVESTQQITRSMKMVSTAKLRQNQSALKKLAPYEQRCRSSFTHVLACSGKSSPLMREPSAHPVTCFVVIFGNRGLCGSYNTDLIKYADRMMARAEGEFFSVICGRWGNEMLNKLPWNITRRFEGLSDAPTAAECGEIVVCLKELFLSGKADRVVIISQKQSGMSQHPGAFTLLPIALPSERKEEEIIFEPDEKVLLETLGDMYASNTFLRTVLEARVAEHFARMTAMTSATDNADDILRELRLEMNRTRQAQITTEISEVVGGANALNDRED